MVGDMPVLIFAPSFSYYELYLSLSQLLKHFQVEPSDHEFLRIDGVGIPHMSKHSTVFNPVQLPKRKEWVAAVPTENLNVKFTHIMSKME